MRNSKSHQNHSCSSKPDNKKALKIAMQMPKSRVDTVSGRIGN